MQKQYNIIFLSIKISLDFTLRYLSQFKYFTIIKIIITSMSMYSGVCVQKGYAVNDLINIWF